MGIGEWAALTAALLWTLSTMLWGQVKLSALGINVCKNLVSTVMIAMHLIVLALVSGTPVMTASPESWGWLTISGLVGIVIGDTVYFRSLQILGPRLALMMATTGPIFAAILAGLVLGEQLKFTCVIGILMTVAGVIVVVADRRSRAESLNLFPGRRSAGILCGILGAICQAVGAVFSKKGMQDCDALEATFIRILIAGIVTVAYVVIKKKGRDLYAAATQPGTLKLMIPATALGTWLGIWCSQIAYKETSNVAVAQTLLATCPLFAIPIVWYFHGHRSTAIAILGTLVAIIGVSLTVQ